MAFLLYLPYYIFFWNYYVVAKHLRGFGNNNNDNNDDNNKKNNFIIITTTTTTFSTTTTTTTDKKFVLYAVSHDRIY